MKCIRCGRVTLGSLMESEEICQECWEEYCGLTFWQMVKDEPLTNFELFTAQKL